MAVVRLSLMAAPTTSTGSTTSREARKRNQIQTLNEAITDDEPSGGGDHLHALETEALKTCLAVLKCHSSESEDDERIATAVAELLLVANADSVHDLLETATASPPNAAAALRLPQGLCTLYAA